MSLLVLLLQLSFDGWPSWHIPPAAAECSSSGLWPNAVLGRCPTGQLVQLLLCCCVLSAACAGICPTMMWRTSPVAGATTAAPVQLAKKLLLVKGLMARAQLLLQQGQSPRSTGATEG
jgi:hypothetical protein